MLFESSKTAFGRHETFPLRYSWLTKGFQQLQDTPSLFRDDDAVVKLGVGKNMVNAIRYWMLASQLIVAEEGRYTPTELGLRLFSHSGFDPYLEDEATIWLIHWLISSNPCQATGWYWFFNRFHKPQFTSQELATALLDFTKQNVKNRCSPNTVKQEAGILLRMYARANGSTKLSVEESLDSPLSLLGLVSQQEGRSYTSQAQEREALPIGILGFAVAQLFDELKLSEFPIEDLMYSKGNRIAPGAVFRLTENSLLTKLEKLIHQIPNVWEIRETAGIHQLYVLKPISPMELLEFHYGHELQEEAA